MPNFWERLVAGFPKNAAILTHAEIPDPTASLTTIKAEEHYFRIWLSQMYLTKAEKWFVDQHPAVNSRVAVKFGGHEKLAFGKVIAPSQDNFTEGVFCDFPLSELLPYRGGIVELTAGFMALPGKNGWKTAVKVLETFSGLVTPPVAQTLAVAQQVSNAVGDFLCNTNVAPHLGLYQTFTSAGGGGGSGFAPGYIAVILAPVGTFNPADFVVENRILKTKKPGGQTTPFASHDFMLFRIEGRERRDDALLKNIEEPLNEALNAVPFGDAKKAEACEMAAVSAALTSPDLTWPDRRLVVQTIKRRLAEVRSEGLGAVAQPGGPQNLISEIRAEIKAASIQKIRAQGPMSFAEAFGP